MQRIKGLPYRIRSHLRCGGVIAYPTEFCYGLGGLPRHCRALKRILHLKKRPQHKGLIVIGSHIGQLQPLLSRLPENDRLALAEMWPAAKTVLLPSSARISAILRGRRRDKLAVRVPDHALARSLCEMTRFPLISTSCNRAGRRPCKTEREVRRQFGREVMVIGGRVGQRRQPSEIIDWQNRQRLR